MSTPNDLEPVAFVPQSASRQVGRATVGLVQINNSLLGPELSALFGRAAADLCAEVRGRPGRYEFLPPLYKRVRIADAVEALKDADLVGFSTYVWNGRISLEIARRLKALKPGIVIVFGGPHVPDQPEAFLRANPQIDLAVHNEGERTFLKLLEAWPDRDAWAALPGVSYGQGRRRVRAQSQHRPRARSRRDPVAVPRGRVRCRSWPPTRTRAGSACGRPTAAARSAAPSATGARRPPAKVTKFGEERLFREVDWFAEKKIEYIFCCDANFGIQKRDVDIANYVADIKQTTGYPVALSVQNTKNATERAYLTQKILSDAGLNKGVALSMQSVDMHDARGDQARQHLARHLHGAAAALHHATGSRPIPT